MNTLLQPGHHPDADQLSAFAEHALPPHEQQQTLAHLAACPDCRALLFLAQQSAPIESPQSQPASAHTSRFATWLTGWTLALPIAALACLILLTLYLRKPPTPQTAPNTTASIHPPQSPLPASPATPLTAPAAPTTLPPKSTLAPRHKNPQPTVNDRLTASASTPPAPIASTPIARQAQLAPQPGLGSAAYLAHSSGGVQGTVTDKSGAVIPKAIVTATNTDTGVQQTVQSNSAGSYSIAPLQPGNYNLEIAASGFQRLLQENVTIDATASQRYDPRLVAGGENTTVTVTDAPPFLSTSGATLGGAIENELYSQLPLAMNSAPPAPAAFQYLMPGMQQNPANNAGAGASNGNSGIYAGTGQTNLNANYIDGVPVSNVSAQSAKVQSAEVQTASSPAAMPAAAPALARSSAPAGPVLLARSALQPMLPSNLPARFVVQSSGRTLALDAAGTLFRSDAAGVTWRPIPTQWQGRALTLRLATPRITAQSAAVTAPVNAAEPAQQPRTLAPPTPPFELTTDSGAVYTSPDGQTWQRK